LYVTDLDKDHSNEKALGNFFATMLPGKHVPLLSVHRKKDGTLFPVEITVARIETPSGPRIMGIAREITERIKIEERSKQTQKMESIGRLAGGIAHDLNNLLTPIIGYAELIKIDIQTQEQTKGKIEHILKAGTGARDLVRQLLAFSRKQVLEYKPLDINQVLDGFQNLIRRTIREDIDIAISKSSELSLVMADIGQIEQVIMNLSVNAADAMPEGGTLSIETSIEHLDEKYAENHQSVIPGKHAMISFSDTGYGMDKETISHIFEPFFSTKGDQGTGLGLSTVYGIIKQHNGNIWVYSEPGIGTTFKVYLPALGEEEELLKTQKSAPATKDLRGSETILLVEDNEQVRETAYDILKQQGYTILKATGGEEAITIIASTDQPVHLLLTDVVMPDMNGKQLYDTLSQIYPSLKVLYMSGYTNDIIVHHGVLDEGVQLIQKPFTNHSFLNKVRYVIDI
jgi:signal transduction histidine kinase